MSWQLLVEDRSSCRYSWTKDWYGMQPDKSRSYCPSSTHVPKAHPTTNPADAEAHDRPRQ